MLKTSRYKIYEKLLRHLVLIVKRQGKHFPCQGNYTNVSEYSYVYIRQPACTRGQ